MKNLFTTLLCLICTLPMLAQSAQDSYTVHTKDGNTTLVNIAENNILRFKDANTLESYMTGFEDFGASNSWQVADIKNITFNIQHENPINTSRSEERRVGKE